ncbi:hypothetical protein G9A89_001788 [Geosiphon pyriformis]|nr:hypothetical protein G9A89_001788 [Geosiphon pyriformis]
MNHNNKPSLSTGENDSSSSHQIDFAPDTVNSPECYCDFEAIAWRTSKKGKNFGRWFWRCPKFRTEDDDDKCKFFQWIDENKPVRFFSSPNNAEENSIGKSTEPIPKNLQNETFNSHIPRFSTPELLEILKTHLNRQDSVAAVQEHKKASTRAELDKAKQEMEDARNQIELLHRENSLLLREMSLLKRELSEVRGLEVVFNHNNLYILIPKGILFGTGDLIAQQIIERKNVHDFKRTGRMIAFGTILAGPAVANWYRVLDRYVTIKNPNNALVTRVAMDQIFFAPCFMGIFFIAQGIMEGQKLESIKKKLEKGYPSALVNNYKLWPAVQLINFRFVPFLTFILISKKALVTRVAMDQIFFAPCFMGIFFIAQGIMEGQKLESIKKKLEKGYPSALVNNYKLWPAVQLINFRFVPLQHRLLVVNTIALGWNTYLSLINVRSSETNENLITE